MAVEPPPKKAKTDEAAVIKPAAAAPVVTPTLTKAAALGLPAQVPFRPVLPSGSDVAGGKTQSLKSYIVQMYKSVVARLSLFLYDCVSVSLRKPLYQVTCPPIAVASASGDTHRPTSFREAWDMKNCLVALRQSGLYEAAMPLWQFEPTLERWEDHGIFPEDVSWPQFLACLNYWNEENFINSATTEEQRRYIFPGFIPTAVKSPEFAELTGGKAGYFTALPLCGAHVLAWSLYGAIDGALHDGNYDRVLRLYEASLSITVRMRVGPSAVQLVLDSLSFVDTLRMQNVASGSHSFFEFVSTVSALPGFSPKSSGPAIVEAAKQLGVVFNAKPIERALAYSILAVMGFVHLREAKAA